MKIGFDHRILSEFSQRDRMVGYLWKAALVSLDSLFKHLFSKKCSYSYDEKKMLLMESFLNIYSFLIHIRGYRSQFRVRDINRAVDNIKECIKILDVPSNTSWKDISHKVAKTISTLRSIDMSNIAIENNEQG